jgi:putative membrane protein
MAQTTIPPFAARRRLHLLILIFAAITIVAGVEPTDRMEWWEGNIPIIAMLVMLTVSYRWWPLSDFSYLLLLTFLLLATLGSHYSYERSPMGAWLAAAWGGVRNPYDRVVHLSVGLLVYYPVYENLPRIARCRAPWSYLLPVAVILAASAIWEIAEVYYGIGMHQNPGYAGTDDIYDSQHDMAIALLGSVIAMTLTAGVHGLRWIHGLRRSGSRKV